MESIVVTAIISAVAALLAATLTATLTAMLTQRRERDADWRKLRLTQYQEYIAALSRVTRGSPSVDERARYADAVNSLKLSAPQPVLQALDAFTASTTSLDVSAMSAAMNHLMRAMRRDIHRKARVAASYDFILQAPPPERPLTGRHHDNAVL